MTDNTRRNGDVYNEKSGFNARATMPACISWKSYQNFSSSCELSRFSVSLNGGAFHRS